MSRVTSPSPTRPGRSGRPRATCSPSPSRRPTATALTRCNPTSPSARRRSGPASRHPSSTTERRHGRRRRRDIVAGRRLVATARAAARAGVPDAGGPRVLGREPGNDVVLADPMVSKRHARLEVGTHIEVVDLNSANGVLVDGVAVQRVRVDEGEPFVIGGTTLVLRLARRSHGRRPRSRSSSAAAGCCSTAARASRCATPGRCSRPRACPRRRSAGCSPGRS